MTAAAETTANAAKAPAPAAPVPGFVFVSGTAELLEVPVDFSANMITYSEAWLNGSAASPLLTVTLATNSNAPLLNNRFAALPLFAGATDIIILVSKPKLPLCARDICIVLLPSATASTPDEGTLEMLISTLMLTSAAPSPIVSALISRLTPLSGLFRGLFYTILRLHHTFASTPRSAGNTHISAVLS